MEKEIKYIKTEAFEKFYPLYVACNGFVEVIKDKKLKEDIIKLIENYYSK